MGNQKSFSAPALYASAWLIAILCGIACYLAATNSLDLFIGGVFFTALLVPPISAIAGRSPGTALAITLGIGISWLMPVHARAIAIWQWFDCVVVLLSFAMLLMSAVQLLVKFKLLPGTASGLVVLAALGWLSWPVWLSASIVGSQLHWSVEFHPLFAINHAVANLGIWTEQQAAYGLTNLGQDVQYQLPGSVWPLSAMQAGLSAFLTVLGQPKKTAAA